MPKEIRIFLDENKQTEADDNIELSPVYAGRKETRSIFIENIIKYPITVNLIAENQKINIPVSSYAIAPNQLQKVDIEFNYNMEELEPIKMNIKLKVSYTI